MSIKQNTFLEFLQKDKFYNKIYESVYFWCNDNMDLIQEKIYRNDIDYISDILGIEMDYKNVWIDDKDDTKIDFDLAINISIEVEGVSGKNRDRDSYESRMWLMIYCTGTLDKKLDDFKIIGVDEYSKSKPKKPLSGDFVPYIKRSEYELYANEILDKFYYKHYPETKGEPKSIDVNLLAKNMGLTVETRIISHDGSIFGQMFFDDVSAKLYNYKTGQYENVNILKDTILVDENAAYLKSYGSKNMTIAHECVHAYYHKKAFLFAQMFNDDLHYIECNIDGTMNNAEFNSSAEWMEIQANGLAPYILMPKESFLTRTKELIETYNMFVDNRLDYIHEIIQELSDTFGVSIYAAKKRLIDLGYEVAIGAFNWVDGHYVRPYTFKKGALEKDETYTISYKDVYKKFFTDPVISYLDLYNNFVFVENHLCINHQDYVMVKNGNLMLTDYALRNMDECCVKFRYKTIKGFNKNLNVGLFSYLSRDSSKEIEFDLEISSYPKTKEEQTLFDERSRIHVQNVNEVVKKISGKPFNEILKYLMNYMDISIKELEFDSGLNERTIRRYLNEENVVPNKRTVVAILRALNIPYTIVNIAIKQSGISFVDGSAEDYALLTVLTNFRKNNIIEVKNFLKSQGFKPLTKENE